MLARRTILRSRVRFARLNTTEAAAKPSGSAPPPPPGPAPPPPPPPQGGSNSYLIYATLLGASGATYYFQDSLKGWFVDSPSAGEAKSSGNGASAASSGSDGVVDVIPSKYELAVIENKLIDVPRQVGEEQKKPVNWDRVRARVIDLLEDESYDDGSYGPVFVRLAWHAAGTYDAKTKLGGSDGAAMRFKPESEWGANAGLALARAKLEPLKREFPQASFSDLWSFAGTVAIEEMGGPKMKWKPGRKDTAEAPKTPLPDGLLPDADGRDHKDANPADHLRDIFYRMGFNDREIVALSGAHALGRCHEDRSGFWGPWTRAPTTFSNEYFRLLVEEKWTPKKTHKGQPWTGPEQYEDPSGDLMMLPTDLVLVKDPKMKPIVEEYVKDEQKFFEDFGKAWIKLQELGVRSIHGSRRYVLFGPRE